MAQNKTKINYNKSNLSKADQEMIDELEYEEKKRNKPYDRFERHWDEA